MEQSKKDLKNETKEENERYKYKEKAERRNNRKQMKLREEIEMS
jgi:hypothetical protein